MAPFSKSLAFLLLCFTIVTTGCASRKKAQLLSDAMVKGVALHGQFDTAIYKDLSEALQHDSAQLIQGSRNRLDAIRQKALFLGEQRLVETLRTALVSDADKFETEDSANFTSADAQLRAAIAATADKKVTDKRMSALTEAAEDWKHAAGKNNTKRKEQLESRLKQFDQATQDWQRFVGGLFDAAAKQVDGIEAELNTALKDLNTNITSLQNHYAAVKDGQDQLNAYLKEKSAIELTMRGLLKGIGLDVSSGSFDSLVGTVTSKVQGRLDGVVDRLNKEAAPNSK